MSDKVHVRMAYVILHYNSIEETRACVESIRQTSAYADSRIVIVDNASPNGTGKTLADEYASADRTDVLLNDENTGFSRGNNLGYQYIREKYDADYITICNNDVVFPDRDYTEKIEKAQQETGFDVLGPDIFQTTLKIHQSPLGADAPTKRDVKRTILLNTLAKLFFPLFWKLFGEKELSRIRNRKDSVSNWDQEIQDVPLMGACLVFSRQFIANHEKAFAPETFLYYEEYLLYQACKKQQLKTIYRPEIQILHNEGRSTATMSANEKDKYRRMVSHTLAAAKIYLKELRKTNA